MWVKLQYWVTPDYRRKSLSQNRTKNFNFPKRLNFRQHFKGSPLKLPIRCQNSQPSFVRSWKWLNNITVRAALPYVTTWFFRSWKLVAAWLRGLCNDVRSFRSFTSVCGKCMQSTPASQPAPADEEKPRSRRERDMAKQPDTWVEVLSRGPLAGWPDPDPGCLPGKCNMVENYYSLIALLF